MNMKIQEIIVWIEENGKPILNYYDNKQIMDKAFVLRDNQWIFDQAWIMDKNGKMYKAFYSYIKDMAHAQFEIDYDEDDDVLYVEVEEQYIEDVIDDVDYNIPDSIREVEDDEIEKCVKCFCHWWDLEVNVYRRIRENRKKFRKQYLEYQECIGEYFDPDEEIPVYVDEEFVKDIIEPFMKLKKRSRYKN